jgi:hypothetical protein
MSTYSAFAVRQRRILLSNQFTSVSFFGFNQTQPFSETVIKLPPSSQEKEQERDEL